MSDKTILYWQTDSYQARLFQDLSTDRYYIYQCDSGGIETVDEIWPTFDKTLIAELKQENTMLASDLAEVQRDYDELYYRFC